MTFSNSGQLKFAEDVSTLMLPLTREREGSSSIWKVPVTSTFPVTDFNEGNPIVASLGFLATIKSEPTVVRSENANELKVG